MYGTTTVHLTEYNIIGIIINYEAWEAKHLAIFQASIPYVLSDAISANMLHSFNPGLISSPDSLIITNLNHALPHGKVTDFSTSIYQNSEKYRTKQTVHVSVLITAETNDRTNEAILFLLFWYISLHAFCNTSKIETNFIALYFIPSTSFQNFQISR